MRGGSRAGSVLPAAAGFLLLPVVFEIAPRIGLLPEDSFPTTSEVIAALAQLATTAAFWAAVRDTLTGWALAWALAVVLGVVLGVAIGLSRPGQLLARLTIDFLRPIPSVALIPLLVLVFGTRPQLKIVLGIFGGLFPVLFQAMYGVQDVDPVARDTTRSFGLGRAMSIRWLVVPSCLPFVATGARLSASVVLLLVVTGEYVVGVAGIGREVLDAQSNGAYAQMYAYVVTAGLLGLAVNSALVPVERRLLHWHPSHRATDVGAVS
jgi:ABC-type nitrate/sulfonate/bicarbonate transport system permease component